MNMFFLGVMVLLVIFPEDKGADHIFSNVQYGSRSKENGKRKTRCDDGYFGRFCEYKYHENLRVRFGRNISDPLNFAAMPLTEQAAIELGWELFSTCDDFSDSTFLPGSRYIENGDTTLVLIYDVRGYIAGVSMAISEEDEYPSDFQKGTVWIEWNGLYHISSYFVNPSIICGSGRSAGQFRKQKVGADLYIQNGTDALSDSVKVPRLESDTSTGTLWVFGRCFPAMGNHYWYNVNQDTPCDKLYPIFIMYDGGKLSGFGYALTRLIDSQRVENPPSSIIGGLMAQPPVCLLNQEGIEITSMHIYLTDEPYRITC